MSAPLLSLLLTLSWGAVPALTSRGWFTEEPSEEFFADGTSTLVSAYSVLHCAARCLALDPQFCGGFQYQPDLRNCQLFGFSEACWSLRATESPDGSAVPYDGRRLRRLGTATCSGTISARCGCPDGFTRCAGRCLTRLADPVIYAEAEQACGDLSAHLLVPRSEVENQCAKQVAADSNGWLGVTDRKTSELWEAGDDCGPLDILDWWMEGQPEPNDEHCAAMRTDKTWNDASCTNPVEAKRPLCQLAACYQPDCDGIYQPPD